jgi:hypothetical protein
VVLHHPKDAEDVMVIADYENVDLNVYIGDLHRIVKDESESFANRLWAEGMLRKFRKGELAREDFLLICARLDRI